jgi:nucleotide-binding universal stress UspA family protein
MNEQRDVIVVGVDGSEASDRALEWALQEGRRRRWTVEVVTAFGYPPLGGGLSETTVTRQAREAAEKAQVEQLARVGAGGQDDVTMAAEVVQGHPVDLLVSTARHARLLVVASRGHGRLHRALMGSVAAGCIRNATCPVVVLPALHLEPLEHDELATLVPAGHTGPVY